MPDGLVLAAGAARQAASLGLERASRRGRPRRPVDLDPAWLTAALAEACPGARVRKVEVLGHTAGTTDRAALRLTYDEPGRNGAPPERVFVKRPPADLPTRVFVNLVRLGPAEARFYREIAPALAIEVPRCYRAEPGGPAQRFTLVLEDLGGRGARLPEVADQIGLDEARRVLETLAGLHAPFLGSPRLETDLAWLRAPGRVDREVAAFERGLPALALRTAMRRHGHLAPPAVRAAGPRIVAARRALERVWAEGPLTVIHGDAHGGNVYEVGGRAGLLDWQLVQAGQGMRDVAYFLVTSLETALRREAEEALVRGYLSALEAAGARPPSFDRAWAQYRLHALYGWQAAMFTAAAAGLQSASNALSGFERASAALADLGSLAALDEVPGA